MRNTAQQFYNVKCYVFTMASGSRCFHISGPIGSAKGPLSLAEYARTFFFFNFCNLFNILARISERESAKWDLSIGNATYSIHIFLHCLYSSKFLLSFYSISLPFFSDFSKILAVLQQFLNIFQHTKTAFNSFSFCNLLFTRVNLHEQYEPISSPIRSRPEILHFYDI